MKKLVGCFAFVLAMCTLLACSESDDKNVADTTGEQTDETVVSETAVSETVVSEKGNSENVVSEKGVPFKASIGIAQKKSALKKATLSDDAKSVVTSWEEGEQVALIYEGCDKECAEDTLIFTITDVSEDGVATIEGVIPEDRHEVLKLENITLVFPASAADKDAKGYIKKDLLNSQKGVLEGEGSVSERYDVRKGTGSIIKDEDCYTLDGTVDMVNQNAIFKFTTKNEDGSENVDAESLTIFIGETEYAVTPEKKKSELYVALPAVDNEMVTFVVASDNHQYAFSKKVSFTAGKYYTSTLKMKDYGKSVAFMRIVANDAATKTSIAASSITVNIGGEEREEKSAEGENEFFMAVPAVENQNVIFVVKNLDDVAYYALEENVTYKVGKLYQKEMKLENLNEKSMAILRISIEDKDGTAGVEANSLKAHIGDLDYTAIKYGLNKFIVKLPAIENENVSFDIEKVSSPYDENILKEITLKAGKCYPLDIKLGMESVKLNGTVRDGATKKVIEGAEVELIKRNLTAKTDVDGKYIIENEGNVVIQNIRFNSSEIYSLPSEKDVIQFVAEDYDTLSVKLNTLDTTLDVSLKLAAPKEPIFAFGYAIGNEPRKSKGCGTTSTLQKTKSVENGERFGMKVGNENREYFITLPKNYDNTKPYKVLLAMHCMGSNAEDFVHHSADQDHPSPYYGQQKLDKNGDYIFVAPRGDTDGMPWSMNSDKDHKFIDQLITTLEENYCVDTTRIFMVGFSFGAMVTNSMAQDMQHRLRAVAVYATADYNIYLPANKGKPIAWMAVHGKKDGTCPYDRAKNSALKRILKNNGKADVDENFTDASSEMPKEVGDSGHLCYDFATVDKRFPVKWCSWNGPHQWTAFDSGNWKNTWVPEETHKFFEQF